MQEFNKGVYDYIIATDEGTGRGDMDSDDENENKEAPEVEEECECLCVIIIFMCAADIIHRPSYPKGGS